MQPHKLHGSEKTVGESMGDPFSGLSDSTTLTSQSSSVLHENCWANKYEVDGRVHEMGVGVRPPA
jgi:hypothetical protein